MTEKEEKELLKLVKENNFMLKQIIKYINCYNNQNPDIKDFTMNVMANLISNNKVF